MSESAWQVGDFGERLESDASGLLMVGPRGKSVMAEPESEQERPYLHCMMVELIDDFFAEFPTAGLSQSRYR
jgi:hypothetical protein